MSRVKYVLIKNSSADIKEQTNPKHMHFVHFLFFCLFFSILLYKQPSYNFTKILNYSGEQTEAKEYLIGTTKTKSHLKIAKDVEASKYFIHTSQCRVPYVDPFSNDTLKIFNPKEYKYTNCTNDEAFITTNYQLNARQYFLHMNFPAIERAVKVLNASVTDVRCCYRQIVRAGSDNAYNLLPCSIFHQDFMIPQHIDYIITECYLNNNKEQIVQKDAFSFIQQPEFNSNNSNNVPATSSHLKKRKPSVLLLGIDSVSRINLRRTMPETFKYLQNNRWFEMQGYNKIGDNTFPNVMALMTSYNLTTATDKCKPKSVGGLNKLICNLIWNNFKQFGYKTAYAEDTYSMSTFNYIKKGFQQPPTDYYLRPMMLAIPKQMKVKKMAGLAYCIGRKHQGEYIFDYALQFANAFPKDPLFGLFWANSFSHNSFVTTATMDIKMLEYLTKMESGGILERSIVIFFADHGIRWGSLLKLKSGFLEERLPMMFISLPSWYRNEYPDFVKALEINQHRLTSPYDIYATLKHILEETDQEIEFSYLNDTVRGLSILHEIPENRTCIEAGITEHWCTCIPYEVLPSTDATATNVTVLVIDEINQYLDDRNISSKCSLLELKSLEKVEIKMYELSNQSTYRITFEANPKKPKFQATAVYDKTSNTITTNVGDISRLDSYATTADCIDLKEAKKFCICANMKS
ncbi:uncharacterized protein LOC129236148 [Anastrepha obliqua]|uniref:uncharacterized protein LOC129236148 n=1 Tax=Anastrepha obliqua TaxID=95512 RepID=UPI00240A2A43|nr:uncharacterized protein LOC129236148 [Anastrepha obliqua]